MMSDYYINNPTSSTMAEAPKVVNKGKRKIVIEPIISKTRMQVTFSKRRPGLFKKASELCSMCGAEAAVITFSSAGKLYSFGHPSADAVIHRYLSSTNSDDAIYGENNDVKLGTFTQKYKDVLTQIDAENKEAKLSSRESIPRGYDDGRNCGFWWDRSIDDLGLVELEQFKVELEGLRNKVVSRVDEIHHRTSVECSIVPQNFDFYNVDQSLVAQGIDISSI